MQLKICGDHHVDDSSCYPIKMAPISYGIVMTKASVATSLSRKLARLREGQSLRVVDVFSGCGGMSVGLQRAGYSILGGIESDPKAASSHAINFFGTSSPDTFVRHGKAHDITTLTPEQFMIDVLQEREPEDLVDVIVGGPPCQAFARVGRAKLRTIMQNPQAYLEDTRANLYIPYLEYVEFFRPLAVIMENVPEIMNFGGKNVADNIADSLEELGYRCGYTILNSAHYGVPQMRHRFFLVAFLAELDVQPSFPSPTHFWQLPPGYGHAHTVALGATHVAQPQLLDDPENLVVSYYIAPPLPLDTLPRAITVQEALSDLPIITAHLRGELKRGVKKFDTLLPYYEVDTLSDYARSMREWPGFASTEGVWDHVIRLLPRDTETFARMSPGDQYPQAHSHALARFEEALEDQRATTGKRLRKGSKAYKELRKRFVPPYSLDKFPNKWWKLVPDEPSRTLTAHMGKDTYSHIHYDSTQARVISVREAARLQSFPDGFFFAGSMNDAFRQIGNAVPPLMAYRLGLHVAELLRSAASSLEERAVTELASSHMDWDERHAYALTLAQQGWKQRTIALKVGVSQGTISRWLKAHASKNYSAPVAEAQENEMVSTSLRPEAIQFLLPDELAKLLLGLFPRHDQPNPQQMYAWFLHQDGMSQTDIASKFGVSQSTISGWIRRVNDTCGKFSDDDIGCLNAGCIVVGQQTA